MLVLLDRDWGGVEADPPPRQQFSVTSVGVIFNQWGVKLPQPPDKSNTAIHAYDRQTDRIATAIRALDYMQSHDKNAISWLQVNYKDK